MVPLEQKEKGKNSRGDIIQVNIDIDAQTDMTWVVLTDPIPAGASLLGSGLGRDAVIAADAGAVASKYQRNSGSAWMAYEERSFESYRAYYEANKESSSPKLREMLGAQGFGQVSVDISQRSFQDRSTYAPPYQRTSDDRDAVAAPAVSTVTSTAPRTLLGALDAYA